MAKTIFDTKEIESNLDNLINSKVDMAVKIYAETTATKLESYMKSNRRWQDRTGMAKARLTCVSNPIDHGYRLALAHGVDYGIWLELANEKRFAIIQPTLQSQSGEILSGLQNLLDKLG